MRNRGCVGELHDKALHRGLRGALDRVGFRGLCGDVLVALFGAAFFPDIGRLYRAEPAARLGVVGVDPVVEGDERIHLGAGETDERLTGAGRDVAHRH